MADSTISVRKGAVAQMDQLIRQMPKKLDQLNTSDGIVSICLLDTNEVIPLEGRNEFTLGRSAEGQPILPDIDLAPFEGFDQGVSRLHASINLGGQQTEVIDLGSANGTRLNGQKIPPHKPYPIKHGDVLALGKFKIQLIMN
jgi:pSer/pThr/pTyr-binding forkhead associated (FHA) protein